MAEYFEIDFLDVESDKSGDAIAVRYNARDEIFIHVVDAGFQSTGESMVRHIRQYYGNPAYIDHVVVTHADGDHAGGVRSVLEEFAVGALWMLRPWIYADQIINRFSRFTSVDALKRRLKEIYSNLAALEEIALARGIPIFEPFQGSAIGDFIVLAPTRHRYLDLIVESDKTPESVTEANTSSSFVESIMRTLAKAANLVRGAWGEETFSTQETSAENEMSVVQYANICGERILLTGDAGRGALSEAAAFAPHIGLQLPGIDRFQVPHHASRRNVSTELLDQWLGPRMAQQPAQPGFTAIVSSAKADPHHPRNSVVRAMIHRGARVICTEGQTICSFNGSPARGWGPVTPMPYPEEQEE